MKRIYNKAILCLILLAGILAGSVYADENCLEIIKRIMIKMDPEVAKKVNLDAHINHRKFIAQFAKKNNIPVFIKQSAPDDEIPFILVNQKTAPKIKHFIENSYATDVALQPKFGNDHGLMRTGNFIIDVDAPGQRANGELHKTGLAWKDFASYMARRTNKSSVILEVSYLLTPEEKRVIDFYQRIRRAAIFRVKFTFKDSKTADHPYLLSSGGEHCFIFCKAQAVTTHIEEIRGKLRSMGIADPERYLERIDVQAKLNLYKNFFLNYSPDKLAPELAIHPKVIAFFNDVYPQEINTVEKRSAFIRWIVSFEASINYNRVLNDLGVTREYAVRDAKNRRASAVLVYDENANVEQFNNGIYESKGAFVTWPSGSQKPVE